ncbi:unnamed protein product [Cuscuta campestris]|uniref:Uncharacterized protein n=1 Tax=Cuscuta campestris TaxID=132261 RepID=A0A484MY28_9ASTE|nr:unnamed protein product [Cuscuta campestris]
MALVGSVGSNWVQLVPIGFSSGLIGFNRVRLGAIGSVLGLFGWPRNTKRGCLVCFGFGQPGWLLAGCRVVPATMGTASAGAAGLRIDSLGSIPCRDRGFNPPKVNLLWVFELALL